MIKNDNDDLEFGHFSLLLVSVLSLKPTTHTDSSQPLSFTDQNSDTNSGTFL